MTPSVLWGKPFLITGGEKIRLGCTSYSANKSDILFLNFTKDVPKSLKRLPKYSSKGVPPNQNFCIPLPDTCIYVTSYHPSLNVIGKKLGVLGEGIVGAVGAGVINVWIINFDPASLH